MTPIPDPSYSFGPSAGMYQTRSPAQSTLPYTLLKRAPETPLRLQDHTIDSEYGDAIKVDEEVEDAETTALKDRVNKAEHQLMYVNQLYGAALTRILKLQNEKSQLKTQLAEKDAQLEISATLLGELAADVTRLLLEKDDVKSPDKAAS